MNKKYIIPAFLCGTLALTSCLDDKESDGVKLIRENQKQLEQTQIALVNAQAEADLAVANANAKLAAAEAKQAAAQAARNEANAKLEELRLQQAEIARKQQEAINEAEKVALEAEAKNVENKLIEEQKKHAEAEAQIEAEKVSLAEAALAVEQANLKAQREFIKKQQELEESKQNAKQEAYAAVNALYGSEVNELNDLKSNLYDYNSRLSNNKLNLEDAKTSKEKVIAENNKKIAEKKYQIELLKKYSRYTEDTEALKAIIADKSAAYDLAVDNYDVKSNEYWDAMNNANSIARDYRYIDYYYGETRWYSQDEYLSYCSGNFQWNLETDPFVRFATRKHNSFNMIEFSYDSFDSYWNYNYGNETIYGPSGILDASVALDYYGNYYYNYRLVSGTTDNDRYTYTTKDGANYTCYDMEYNYSINGLTNNSSLILTKEQEEAVNTWYSNEKAEYENLLNLANANYEKDPSNGYYYGQINKNQAALNALEQLKNYILDFNMYVASVEATISDRNNLVKTTFAGAYKYWDAKVEAEIAKDKASAEYQAAQAAYENDEYVYAWTSEYQIAPKTIEERIEALEDEIAECEETIATFNEVETNEAFVAAMQRLVEATKTKIAATESLVEDIKAALDDILKGEAEEEQPAE